MQKWMMGLAAGMILALTGCGGSACDELADGSSELEKKITPCLDAGETIEKFNVNQCEAGIEKCSDAEKEAMSKFADCLADVPECSPATEQSFANSVAACALQLEGKVGDTCSTAVFGS